VIASDTFNIWKSMLPKDYKIILLSNEGKKVEGETRRMSMREIDRKYGGCSEILIHLISPMIKILFWLI
jgi:hypothetical protein